MTINTNPVAQIQASDISYQHSITLPAGSGLCGLCFEGSPPRLVTSSHAGGQEGELTVPPFLRDMNFTENNVWYVQTLHVPSMGYFATFIAHTQQLEFEIQRFQHCEDRTLIFRQETLARAPTLWKLTLPTATTSTSLSAKDSYLGMILKGFPPVLTDVLSEQGSNITLPPQYKGLVVDRLIVPNVCDMSLAKGGFTNLNVLKALHDSNDVPNRILILTEPEQGSNQKKKKRTPLFDTDLFSFRRRSNNA